MKFQHIVLVVTSVIVIAGCAGQQTPKPSSTASVQQTAPAGYPVPAQSGYPAANQTQAASNLATIAPPSQPTEKPDPERTPLIITSVTHTADGLEKIVVSNISKEDQSLNGVVLVNAATGVKIYLGMDKTLSAGAAVNVYNGAGQIEASQGLKWTDKSMMLHDYDELLLLNKSSRVISDFIYYQYMK
jgi:hypothetical protein